MTAIRLGINNIPNLDAVKNLKAIADNVFQPIRDHFDVPIGVSSGYRSHKLNKAVGGSRHSQHTKGEALDIDADIYGRISNDQIFEYIRDNLQFDQLIWEFGDDDCPDWVHVSYKADSENRMEVLRAFRMNGMVLYRRS